MYPGSISSCTNDPKHFQTSVLFPLSNVTGIAGPSSGDFRGSQGSVWPDTSGTESFAQCGWTSTPQRHDIYPEPLV